MEKIKIGLIVVLLIFIIPIGSAQLEGNYIIIRNLGLTGLEQSNPEFTSTKTVLLELNFSETALNCQYTNYDNPNQEPPDTYYGWTPWEPCIVNRIWLLTENPGLKTVYYKIDYSGSYAVMNDSIYFNYTGAGLDTTPPIPPVIVDGDYSNIDTEVTINWYNASDPESDLFNLPLQYEFVLYLEDGTILDTYSTTETTRTVTGLSLAHNDVIYANVSVINSVGMRANATSDGLVIDLEKPYISDLDGSFKNESDNRYYNMPNPAHWVHAKTVNFTWLGYDDVTTDVSAYSYILTQNQFNNPDNSPEGGLVTTKAYSNLPSGKYYFKIITRDLAGNWGDPESIEFWIDNTAPSKSEILSEDRIGGNITYTWSEAYDYESNVVRYMLNLTDEGSTVKWAYINDTNDRQHKFTNVASGNYYAIVGALNGVGIWKWSNEKITKTDFDPPIIVALPNKTVVSNSVVLKAWTNEQANCYHNSSAGDILFAYSNTTYHETKLNLINGAYSFDITCIDLSYNSKIQNIKFDVDTFFSPDAVNGPGIISTYINTITGFSVEIFYGINEITGIKKDKFSLKIDNKKTEFGVFDRGSGYYNITFQAPSTPGSYNLLLSVDSNNLPLTLNVIDVFLSTSYEEPGIAPDDTTHITYHTSDMRIGLATDSYKPVINSNNNLNMSNISIENRLYIFNTKPGISMSNREKLLKSREFITLPNPSFGHQLDEKYIVNSILKYINYSLISDIGNTLGSGYHELDVITTTENNKQVIKFVKSGELNQIILKYD